jgi:hypothetical protein
MDVKSATKRKQKQAFWCRFQTPSDVGRRKHVHPPPPWSTRSRRLRQRQRLGWQHWRRRNNPHRVYFCCSSLLNDGRRHSLIPRLPTAGSRYSAVLQSGSGFVRRIACGVHCSLVCVIRFTYKYIIKKYPLAYIDIILFCTIVIRHIKRVINVVF